jgi:hypothetical protein
MPSAAAIAVGAFIVVAVFAPGVASAVTDLGGDDRRAVQQLSPRDATNTNIGPRRGLDALPPPGAPPPRPRPAPAAAETTQAIRDVSVRSPTGQGKEGRGHLVRAGIETPLRSGQAGPPVKSRLMALRCPSATRAWTVACGSSRQGSACRSHTNPRALSISLASGLVRVALRHCDGSGVPLASGARSDR